MIAGITNIMLYKQINCQKNICTLQENKKYLN